jgi:hypothetical protein
VEINKLVRAYLGARALMQYEHLREMGHDELRLHGLNQPLLLIELEKRVQKYLDHTREKERDAENLKRLTKSKRGL